ncbi:hypothetical protein C8J57DRAFT_1536867 [Mycena rebaudengoi]|nr:hypothetical protein C8J57DRAFT_1536867 [Mycena rebaudengoi]
MSWYVTPLFHTRYVICESWINHAHTTQANFAADGVVVMDVRAHVNFMAPMFLLLLIFLLNQLPLFYGIQVDSDCVLTSISFKVNSVRETVGIWENTPGFCAAEPQMLEDGSSTEPPEPNLDTVVLELVPQDLKHSAIMQRWRLHYNRFSRHILYVVVNEKEYPINATGALLNEAPLISDPVDHLGNPIEPGAFTEAISAAKKAAALKRKLGAAEVDSSESEETKAKGKHKAKGKAKATSLDVESSSEDAEPKVCRNKKHKGQKSAPTTEDSSASEGPTPAGVVLFTLFAFIAAWNIKGNLALKITTLDFRARILANDIAIFMETFLRPSQETSLPLPARYVIFSMARPNRPNLQPQAGDGLDVLVLDFMTFFVISAYLPPEGSPWEEWTDVSPEDKLATAVTFCDSNLLKPMFLKGDINACTKAELPKHSLLTRASQDVRPPSS